MEHKQETRSENPDFEEYNQQLQSLRREFILASRNLNLETQEERSKETILSELKEVQLKIIEVGLANPNYFKKTIYGVSEKSFKSPSIAAKNFFFIKVHDKDYYAPAVGQTLTLIDDEDKGLYKGGYEFRVLSESHVEDLTSVRFSFRNLSQDYKDVVYMGGIEFSDVDSTPSIVMSPYPIDIYQPDELQKANTDKAKIFEMKALRSFTDLICTPDINLTSYQGRRNETDKDQNEHPLNVVTSIEYERSQSASFRRKTIRQEDVMELGKVSNLLYTFLDSIDEDVIKTLKKEGNGELRFGFYLAKENDEGEDGQRRTVYYKQDEYFSTNDVAKASEYVHNLLESSSGDKVVVTLEGMYTPKDWDDPDHQKKHTRPHIRRQKRKNGDDNSILVIDDRASEEWLKIKGKINSWKASHPKNGPRGSWFQILDADEKDLVSEILGIGNGQDGIHLQDGTYSLSEAPINKKYSSNL